MAWMDTYRAARTEAAKALASLRSGSRIFIGSGCGEPRGLLRELAAQAVKLRDVEVVQAISVAGEAFTEARYADSFQPRQFFVAAEARRAVSEGRSDYTPLYLSDVARLVASGRLAADAALIQVSPPDEHGYVSLGVSVDILPEVLDQARVVIAQVNPCMPRTLGAAFVPVSRLDHVVELQEDLTTFTPHRTGERARKVARQAVRLIEDGSTIHCSLGELAQAVLAELGDHRELGVHTDVLTDAYVGLVESGAITGRSVGPYPGKIVASFCLGTSRLFQFVDNNPMVEMQPASVTNDPSVIARNPRMVTVHEAVEMDLTGQVCADAIGGKVYSGVGGMVDFTRGAIASPGGQSIVLMKSTYPDGTSRIRPSLSNGAGVGLTRATVRTVATEYGAVYLHGLGLRERAVALIDIAHPNHRDNLLAAARELGLISGRQILAPLFTGVYPEEFERALKLKDGEALLVRPVKPTDERAVQEFFYAMSDREVYYRFLHAIKAFPTKDMQRMVNIDYSREMSVLAMTGEFGSEKVAGVARYVVGEGAYPEVDFAVRSSYQGRGLGHALAATLADIAKARGFEGLSAVVMNDNDASLKLLYGLGYAVTGTVSQGLTEIRVHFDRPVDKQTVELEYQPRDIPAEKPPVTEEPLTRL